MRIFALIENGKVSEIFETDLDIKSIFHPDLNWVEVEVAPAYGESAWQENGQWVFTPADEQQPTREELSQSAEAKIVTLMHEANQKTVGMSDAYVAGILDGEDKQFFESYATYKLSLAKVTKQEGFPEKIEWPAALDS